MARKRTHFKSVTDSTREPEREVIWLPDLDLNQDKQIQSLLCYRYTIGQTEASEN